MAMPNIIPLDRSLAGQTMKMAPPEALLPITEMMVAHGYPDGAVAAILGGNWRRVAGQVCAEGAPVFVPVALCPELRAEQIQCDRHQSAQW